MMLSVLQPARAQVSYSRECEDLLKAFVVSEEPENYQHLLENGCSTNSKSTVMMREVGKEAMGKLIARHLAQSLEYRSLNKICISA